MIEGMSKDQSIVINEKGGGQSNIPYRFDLIDAKALFEMAKILSEGANKYGVNNWRLIPTEDHINHAISHLYAHLAGDRQDDHLGHAFCRAMFALAVSKEEIDSALEDF